MNIITVNRDLLADAEDFAESEDRQPTRKEIEDCILADGEESELDDLFDEWLDEAYESVEIAGTTIDPSQILKECDPIAYRVARADWMDDLYVEVDLDDYPTASLTESEEN